MDNSGDIHPVTFEPVRKLLIAAYKSGDFSSADAVIVRNTVQQTAMVWKLMNGCMDAYCWSSGQAVAHMLSRTSHPGYTLQLTDFVCGRPVWDVDIRHAGELTLPDGACVVGVENANSGVEDELAEHFGIYLTEEGFEKYGHEIACLGNRETSRDMTREDVSETVGCNR